MNHRSLRLLIASAVLIAGVTAVVYWRAGGETVFLASLADPVSRPPANWPLKPKLVNGALPAEVEAEAFAVAWVLPSGETEILLEKNGHERLPLASISKLVTASVAFDSLDPGREVVLSPRHFPEPADLAELRVGESFTVRDLFYPLLISSSNAAAAALADQIGEKEFVAKMNEAALREGLQESYFYNPTGLDPQTKDGAVNYSSALDLVKLARSLLLERRPLLNLTRLPGYDLYSLDRRFRHRLENVNKLLTAGDWSAEIIGGKTGSTDLAQKNILLVLENKFSPGYLIVAVLGSADHFKDAAALTDWAYQVYEF